MKSVLHTFHIEAPFETVYHSLSSIEGLSNWWTKDTSGNCNIGDIITFKFGEFAMHKKVIESKVNEIVEWECLEGNPDWEDTLIKFALSENDNKVKVEFSHIGFNDNYQELPNINFTWGRFLVSLRNLCETGKGDPYIHS